MSKLDCNLNMKGNEWILPQTKHQRESNMQLQFLNSVTNGQLAHSDANYDGTNDLLIPTSGNTTPILTLHSPEERQQSPSPQAQIQTTPDYTLSRELSVFSVISNTLQFTPFGSKTVKVTKSPKTTLRSRSPSPTDTQTSNSPKSPKSPKGGKKVAFAPMPVSTTSNIHIGRQKAPSASASTTTNMMRRESTPSISSHPSRTGNSRKVIPESRIAKELRLALYNVYFTSNVSIRDKDRMTMRTKSLKKLGSSHNNSNFHLNNNPYATTASMGHLDEFVSSMYLDENVDLSNLDQLKLNPLQIKIICDTIISAFESLYNKYIDDSCAVYMINISGRRRARLKKLFDANYYKNKLLKQQQQHENNSRKASFARRSSNLNISYNFSKLEKLFGYNNGNLLDQNEMKDEIAMSRIKNTGQTFLKYELETHMNGSKIDRDLATYQPPIIVVDEHGKDKSENSNDEKKDENKNENKKMNNVATLKKSKDARKSQAVGQDAIEWLLTRIFSETHQAFIEITVLMKDSFSRFNIDEKLLDQLYTNSP